MTKPAPAKESPVRGNSPRSATAPLLAPRKYREAALPWLSATHSVWLAAEGQAAYFPVEARNEREAVPMASAMAAELRQAGWSAFCQRHPREFCCAVFWLERPVSVTYATLFTGDPRANKPVRTPEGGRTLLLVEPDPEMRRMLGYWFSRQPGCQVAAAVVTPGEALTHPILPQADLILFNRFLPDQAAVDLRERFAAVAPSAHVFSFGILAESDDLFRVLSGVEQGYYFRRRQPEALFEPLAGAWGALRPTAEALDRSLRGYFRGIFDADRQPVNVPGADRITYREQQILNSLRLGLSDKEIAQNLGISPQTVHTHLKHIFEKLDAHSRTEAVMKFLQK